MALYWLEQTASEVPVQADWLNPGESLRVSSMRFPKRRADWLLGRWTAKNAIAAFLQIPRDFPTLASIEICPEPSGAPEAYLSGSPAGVSISLSHSSGVAVCAVAESGVVLGCDLELVAPHSDAFVRDYFTTEERSRIAQVDAATRCLLVALLWSAKESALKALRTGLRSDTRDVVATATFPNQTQPPRPAESGAPCLQDDLDAWHPLQTCCSTGQVFYGWWQQRAGFVRTIVAAPSSPPPVRLRRLIA